MKLFNVNQIREWDRVTIENEPIPSIDLMERAAKNCFLRLMDSYSFTNYGIVCGPGNNGGDGLAIARFLLDEKIEVAVFIPEITENFSEDFKINLNRLPKEMVHYFSEQKIPDFNQYECVIDAFFGSGLDRGLEGFPKTIVEDLNKANTYRISIDIPSGMYADFDEFPDPKVYVKADKIYTFQVKKTSFFNQELREILGIIEVLDIGLCASFSDQEKTNLLEITREDIHLKEAADFSHKFNLGFALIIGGSKGKYGAPILSAKAALKTGCGLVSLAIPSNASSIAHISMNELMLVDVEGKEYLENVTIPDKINAVGIGPGLDRKPESLQLLKEVFRTKNIRFVVDADALNVISEHKELFKELPQNTIITPHVGEFVRLFGSFSSEQEKLKLLQEKAIEHQLVIVLKGKITTIASPSGIIYFSEEVGNKGLATAGSGDVLTGIITSFLAQGYSEIDAATCGVYVHGLAGDLYLEDNNYRSLTASDIINRIGKALKNLTN